MSITVSNVKDDDLNYHVNQLDTGIMDAKTELRRPEVQVRRLKPAIQTFLENKKADITWPRINKTTDKQWHLSRYLLKHLPFS